MNKEFKNCMIYDITIDKIKVLESLFDLVELTVWENKSVKKI